MNAQCPACSKRFNVSEKMYGKTVKCPCGQTMKIPLHQTTTQPVATQSSPVIADNAADPLGIGNLNYGTDLTREQSAAIRPKPKPKSVQRPGPAPKPEKESVGGMARLFGFGQIIVGLVMLGAAVFLFIASFEAERVKGRAYQGMLILAIVGCGLMASGAKTLFAISD